MASQTNPQLDLAFNFVQYTHKNIFLTGKAGTGKTTFLHNLKKSSPKRMAIVAPTGVAAINAGGVTIHSFFQLPFGPYIPGQNNKSQSEQKRFNRDKIKLIQGLDLLVIDEISMVRADMLDAIDAVLRRYKDKWKPFGGVQLLMIGDLHQLSPVIKPDEWEILRPHYETVYFFSSQALKQTDPISIELKHIYRQSDTYFIDMLNKIRDNAIDVHLLNELNQRYIPDFKPSSEEGYITLTTHNASAQEINLKKLQELAGRSYSYEADIKDDFPQYSYPTEQVLELKIGSQVMFVKNDISREKLFYNGKIGVVTRIEEDTIYVKCPTDMVEIPVGKLEWQNIKYSLDTTTKEIKEDIIGSFTQYPLKLAWAITIHKSQGLTFERAIIDAQSAFAHGQVYVALSRCKSFEGLVLRTPIPNSSIKTDATIAAYTRESSRNEPNEGILQQAKINFQQAMLEELFDFRNMRITLNSLERTSIEFEQSLGEELARSVQDIKVNFEQHLFSVGEKFKLQMTSFYNENTLPEQNLPLQERVQKASSYFEEKLHTLINQPLAELLVESDNKDIKQRAKENLEALQRLAFIRTRCFKAARQFDAIQYLHTKANADIDFRPQTKSSQQQGSDAGMPKVPNPKLYSLLRSWRDALAAEKDTEGYEVIPHKTMVELVSLLPTDMDSLKAIKGIGKVKANAFGQEIIDIVADYCRNNGIVPEPITSKSKNRLTTKTDTKRMSYDMYRSGKTIEEIAAERGFAAATIENHLATFVATGEIPITDFVNRQKLDVISGYITQNPAALLSEIRIALGNEFSFSEIKMAKAYADKSVAQ